MLYIEQPELWLLNELACTLQNTRNCDSYTISIHYCMVVRYNYDSFGYINTDK